MTDAERIADLERRVEQLEQAVLALIEDGTEPDDRPASDLEGNAIPPLRTDVTTL